MVTCYDKKEAQDWIEMLNVNGRISRDLLRDDTT